MLYSALQTIYQPKLALKLILPNKHW